MKRFKALSLAMILTGCAGQVNQGQNTAYLPTNHANGYESQVYEATDLEGYAGNRARAEGGCPWYLIDDTGCWVGLRHDDRCIPGAREGNVIMFTIDSDRNVDTVRVLESEDDISEELCGPDVLMTIVDW